MTTLKLMRILRNKGIKLFLDSGKLKAQDPEGALTPELLEGIRDNKTKLIRLLSTSVTEIKKISKIDRKPANVYPVLSAAQKRLWFLSELEGGSTSYSECFDFLLNGDVSIGGLNWTFSELIKRHSILRTSFNKKA